jgi:hypothetical protein
MATETKAVYLGRHATDSKKTAHLFVTVHHFNEIADADALRDKASAFEFKKSPPKIVGGVYTIHGDLDSDGRFNKLIVAGDKAPLFTGERAGKRELVGIFEARDKAFGVADRARKLTEQMKDDLELPKLLKRMRQRFGATDAIGRLALEVVILDALRRP